MFSLGICQADHLFLQDGHLLHGDLHSHIPPGHHNAVGYLQDFFQVLDSLHVLYLKEDITQGTTILIDDGLIEMTVEEICGEEIVCRVVICS